MELLPSWGFSQSSLLPFSSALALKTVKAMESTEDKALILAVIAGECVEIGQTEEAGHMLVQAFERAKTIKDASLDSKGIPATNTATIKFAESSIRHKRGVCVCFHPCWFFWLFVVLL